MNQFDTHLIYVDEELTPSMSTGEYKDYLDGLKAEKLFSGKAGEVYALRFTGRDALKNVIFVGIGKEDDWACGEKISNAFGGGIGKARALKAGRVLVLMDDRLSAESTAKAIEAMHLAKYSFKKYKTGKDEDKKDLTISISSPLEIKKMVEEAVLLADQTCVARDLVNEPANVITPAALGDFAQREGARCGFKVEVYDMAAIEALGMEAFLAVGKGSGQEPRLIVMSYEGNPGGETIALVGKGLTYDSGGYSLKPSAGMANMKTDMGGAAAVIGAVGAIAKAGLKANVVGIIAACENLISGHSYKPGDIIGSMGGKYIEVDNTDAEGRLTLIDAVTYAINVKQADKVIDIATLTGAAIIALGTGITAALCNNEELWEAIDKAACAATEKIWRMPCDEELGKGLKSEIADLKNTGGRSGGMITGGLFVGEFVGNTPWAHLDIAGPSFTEKAKPTCCIGGTGVGVRTLYHTVKNLSQ